MANFCTKCLVEVDAHTFRFHESRVYCRPCLVNHKEWQAQLKQIEELARGKAPRSRFEREDPI